MRHFFLILSLGFISNLCFVSHIFATETTVQGAFTKIHNLQQAIAKADKYSVVFRNDTEKYYIAVLEGNEDADEYISFYKSLFEKKIDNNLLTPLKMRYIRGLLHLCKTEEAIELLQEIDLKGIANNKEEIAYYKLLVAISKLLSTKSIDELQNIIPLYEDAINSYKECNGSNFELSQLYSEYSFLYIDNNIEKTCELIFTALSFISNDIAFLASQYISNLKSLTKVNAEFQPKLFEMMDEFVASASGDKKIILLTALIEENFWGTNLRLERKYLDELYSALTQCSSPDLKAHSLFIAAQKEDYLGNHADAKALYEQCIKFSEDTNAPIASTAKVYANLYQMGEAKDFANYINKMLTRIIASKEFDKQKAHWYAELALAAIICNEKDIFEQLATLSNNIDKGVALGHWLKIFLCNEMITQYGKEKYIDVASKLTAEGINEISPSQRFDIAYNLAMMEADVQAKRFSFDESSDFLISIATAETLVEKNNEDAFDNALKLLKDIKPVSYELMNVQYTDIDAQIWVKSLFLRIFLVREDLSNLKLTVTEIETLLEKRSDNFDTSVTGIVLYGNMGATYISLSQYSKGLSILEPLSSLIPDDPNILNALGQAYGGLGYLPKSIECFRKAVDIYRVKNDTFNYIRTSQNLAHTLALVSESQEAKQIHKEIIPLMIKHNLKNDLARAYHTQQFIILNNKNISRKEKIFELNALRKNCLETTDNPAVIVEALKIFAQVNNDNNMPADIIIEDIELYFKYQQMFANAVEEETLLSQRDTEMKVMLFSLLAEIGDVQKLDYWNKIFEKQKTRTIENVSVAATSKNKEFLSLLTLVEKYENASQIIEQENIKPLDKQDKILLAKATALKREIEQYFDKAKKRLSPVDQKKLQEILADNFVIHPDSLGQLSAVLPDDVVCVQFLPVGEKIMAYIIASSGRSFVTTISLEEKNCSSQDFTKTLLKVRALLQNPSANIKVKKELRGLYELLFAELEPTLAKLNAKKLIVNSSGILRYLPVAALYDGNKFLVEKYQITNVTGLDLIRLTKTPPRRNATETNVAIFADPDGSLPAGRQEGKEIAALFASNRLFVGDQASLLEFESLHGNVNFIHLATHAVLDPNEPEKSYILFAGGKKWYYSDMMGFNVKNVDSIALSACSTAVSERSTGGEIEGMAYQLLKKSPSGCVIASFWKVDDAATAQLMNIYYKHITDSMKNKARLDRGGALHEAQLALLHNANTASPYYWAAFTLFGDFR